ncbi:GrpB family protein [Actinopolymorpha pittospori]
MKRSIPLFSLPSTSAHPPRGLPVAGCQENRPGWRGASCRRADRGRARAVAEQIADLTGYEYLRDHGAPGREYLRRRTTLPWSNAHVVELNGDLWRDNLALRDFLRSTPEAVQEYAAAKRLAAERTGWLRAYSTAKADTVVALLERARHWARAQGHARS